ncbi:MAG TPA: HlyD family efflux transporter periplasmic adaptor subunit, partial [Methylomirabilota bacterium]|nr:HlyD family efflux transporter periplasmic adaptor subunit [Methylomirabilota bacterium]
EAAAAAAALVAARAAYQRAHELNAAGKIVSDKALQEAEARMKGERARLEAARANVRLGTRSLDATTGATGPITLSLDRAGEVVEVRAQPGEAIESGQPILRVAGFDTLLAKVDVPPDEAIDRHATTARLLVVGLEGHVLAAERVSLAPTDPRTQGHAWLFRVGAGGLMLRPGQAVTAYLAAPGSGRAAVIIPRSAVVRFAGKTWVYVATGPERFTRVEIALEHPTPEGWAVSSGVGPGQAVVVDGAALLLSEEQRSQIQIEG